MSPLTFLVVANLLDWNLTKDVESRLIKEVFVLETGNYFIHAQCIDDTHVLVEASKYCIENVLTIFRDFGLAYSLFIKGTRIKFVLISSHPLPDELLPLDLAWESDGVWSKLLGFYVGIKILAYNMTRFPTLQLEDWLHCVRKAHHSITMRVAICNQLVGFEMWYMLYLWSGDN